MVAQKSSSSSRIRIVCISTSFKHYDGMVAAANILKEQGFSILAPEPSHIRHGHAPHKLKEEKYDRKTLEKWEAEGALAHLANIRKSDMLYLYNPDSYLGPAVAVEIGYALAFNKPIYAYQPVKDITLTNFVTAVVEPDELKSKLKMQTSKAQRKSKK